MEIETDRDRTKERVRETAYSIVLHNVPGIVLLIVYVCMLEY